MEETLYSILWSIGGQCSSAKSGEACVRLEILKKSLAEQCWTFLSFSVSCRGIPDESYSSQDVTIPGMWREFW